MALKANVCIETALRAGRTVLQKSFCQPPFKIADVTEDKNGQELQLILMSSSPGVLDGDDYNFDIQVGEESSLFLQTQSYQRLFQMKTGAAQTMNLNLQRGSSFVYLPHPVVPHKNSNFSVKNKICLAENCTLIWGEVISCGRKLNDEVFLFSFYHSVTEISLCGKLVVKENLLLKPTAMNVTGIGQMEGFTHQASFLYLNGNANADELTDIIYEALHEEENIAFGISTLSVSGFVVRVLGHQSEPLFHLLKNIHAIITRLNLSMSLKTAAGV